MSMICWHALVVASSLLPLSSQLARFLKLPEGYYLNGDVPDPDVILNSPSLKDCILEVTKEKLATGTVSSYSFESSTESCYVYRSPVIIDYAEALNAATLERPGMAAGATMPIPAVSSLPPTTTKTSMLTSLETTSTVSALTVPLHTSSLTLGTTRAPTTNAASATAMRLTNKVPSTKQATPTTPKPTTTASVCLPVNPNMHASVVIDSSSPMTVMRPQAQASASCLCNIGKTVQRSIRREFYPSSVTSKPSAEGAVTNEVIIECKNKGHICVVAENGTAWIQGTSPPDFVFAYSYCEANHGCHMYLGHYSESGATNLKSGSALIAEASYWTWDAKKKREVLKDIGFKSDYIKAAAISCGGCANIAKYKSFVCNTPAPAD